MSANPIKTFKEIEQTLELGIEKASYTSKLSVINRTAVLFGIWEAYNDCVVSLKTIDPVFFRELDKLNRPEGTQNKLFMQDRYYHQFTGTHAIPILDAFKKMKEVVVAYNEGR